MRAPNPEQKKAIEHTGGVLLSAGAGSGKTFVLENHILYLTTCWISEYRNQPAQDFSLFIRQKFKNVVLMTFTKKAAGELNLRIRKAFEQKAEQDDLWKQSEAELNALTIGTIHSFCFKLISQGFFPQVPSGQNVISDGKFRSVIEEIYDNWLIQLKEIDFRDLFHKNRSVVLASVFEILGDPTLRMAWAESKTDDFNEKEMNKIIEALYLEYGIISPQRRFSLTNHQEHKKLKWFQFLEEYLSKNSGFNGDMQGLLQAIEFFRAREFKMPAARFGKNVDSEIISFYSQIKALKDFCKNYGDSFSELLKHKDSIVIPWLEFISDMMAYVESEYAKLDGLTFSDLEYYLLQGLQNESTCQKISEQYRYFIVDEFQDTSHIQFEILKKLTQGDLKRLFCVGDLKQAIYGFRGGELGVFLECSQQIDQNLSLKNNYRSSKAVINFNNTFFQQLFKYGIGFTGRDKNTVPFQAQAVPETTQVEGAINQLLVEPAADSEEKVSNNEIEWLEASAIVEHIKTLPIDEDKAILYRRLAPSFLLIQQLITEQIGFTAQVKVPFKEDPIIGIFYSLLEWELNSNLKSKDQLVQDLINCYLCLLGGEPKFGISMLEQFLKERQYFGLMHAFENLLNSLGIANASFRYNLQPIREIIESEVGPEKIYLKLKQDSKLTSSLDFKYGEDADQIFIMTTHASKGLEFDHVFLGGIYTNDGASGGAKPMVGKTPASFVWMPSIYGKKKFKTPHMLLEDIVWKYKEYSENKRLFYVANTRAVKTLSWVEIDFSQRKRERAQAGCWANGIQTVLSEINIPCQQISIKLTETPIDFKQSKNKKPMFHIDNLGVYVRTEMSSHFILPELSVTRLSQLENCPRRFYLADICKIKPEDLELLKDNPVENYPKLTDEHAGGFKSSAVRGSELHAAISHLIKADFCPQDLELEASDAAKVDWAVEKVHAIGENYQLISERQIKFEVFGYMLSGIPDLYALPVGSGLAQIWDFKTGSADATKLAAYWFQLYTYAFGLFQLKQVSREKPINLVLCFLDEQKIIEQKVLFVDVEKYLKQSIAKVKTPWEKNLNHCGFCPYVPICEQ